MAFDFEMETQRHMVGWKGFVRIATWSTAAAALVLVLMALFLV